jgi:hypothetical protein
VKVNSTVVGLVVLGLVAAGGLWVRLPSPPAAAQQGEGDDALPDVTLAAGTADAGGVQITLSLSPNPPVAFATMRVRVRAESAGSVVALERPRVSFEMAMPMGDHRYSLVAGEEGWLEAAVVLPT